VVAAEAGGNPGTRAAFDFAVQQADFAFRPKAELAPDGWPVG
jgi:hypothetical protein